MRTIDIPGGTATLRDIEDIRQRDKRLVLSASIAAVGALVKIGEQEDAETSDMTSLGLTLAEAESFADLQYAVVIAELAAWSIPEPLPTLQTIGDLKPAVYDALEEATQKDLNAILGVADFSPSDPTKPGFSETPTLPSGDSAVVSRANKESESTDTSTSFGQSTDSDPSSPDSPTTTT
jgi:hypothetical protein